MNHIYIIPDIFRRVSRDASKEKISREALRLTGHIVYTDTRTMRVSVVIRKMIAKVVVILA